MKKKALLGLICCLLPIGHTISGMKKHIKKTTTKADPTETFVLALLNDQPDLAEEILREKFEEIDWFKEKSEYQNNMPFEYLIRYFNSLEALLSHNTKGMIVMPNSFKPSAVYSKEQMQCLRKKVYSGLKLVLFKKKDLFNKQLMDNTGIVKRKVCDLICPTKKQKFWATRFKSPELFKLAYKYFSLETRQNQTLMEQLVKYCPLKIVPELIHHYEKYNGTITQSIQKTIKKRTK